LPASVGGYGPDGHRWDAVTDLLEQEHHGNSVDITVALGVQERLPCRLVAVQVPQEVVDQRRRRLRAQARAKGKTVSARRRALWAWTIFLTNVPAEQLSLQEMLAIGRARRQIELLFKLWKSHGKIDESRSAKPDRVLCDVYAKLPAMVVQHWLCLVALWAYPDSESGEGGQDRATKRPGTGQRVRRSGALAGGGGADWDMPGGLSHQQAAALPEHVPTAVGCHTAGHWDTGGSLSLMRMGCQCSNPCRIRPILCYSAGPNGDP